MEVTGQHTLAGSKQVNAASSHYGVWNFKGGLNGYPVKYVKKDCNPLLVLHPKKTRFKNLNLQNLKFLKLKKMFCSKSSLL